MDGLKVGIERSYLSSTDVDSVHRLLGQLTTREIKRSELAGRLEVIINNQRNGSRLFTARVMPEKEIVGMATMTIKVIPAETAAYLDDVVADENFPIKGVGTALMEAVVAEADTRGIPINLTCAEHRERAMALYQKFGFVTGETMPMRRMPQKRPTKNQ